jgi:hypothetical protein
VKSTLKYDYHRDAEQTLISQSMYDLNGIFGALQMGAGKIQSVDLVI